MSLHVENLVRDECLDLLRAARVGRVGLSSEALPIVLPVNFAVIDGAIVFRTAAGTKLAAAVAGAVVAFETDGFAWDGRSGWSVLVQGIARIADDAATLAAAEARRLESWASGDGAEHLVRVELQMMSGRRFRR